jgi:hypothetical protein
LERGGRLEADGIAAATEEQERTAPGADGTALQPFFIKPNWAKMLTVTAILPLHCYWGSRLAFKIQFSQNVTAILTLNRALSGSKKTLLMLWAEYSHLG